MIEVQGKLSALLDQLATSDPERDGGELGIDPYTLTPHADRGAAMQSKTAAEMLSDPHVTRSHSRPNTSNDNPYSEAQLKTLKCPPVNPDRFDSIGHAGEFFRWHNTEHRHSGIGLHTTASAPQPLEHRPNSTGAVAALYCVACRTVPRESSKSEQGNRVH